MVVAMAHDVTLAELSDRDLLALLIAGESANQEPRGQVAVACTVTERLRRRRAYYGLTLRNVMLMPAQYSTFNEPAHWRKFWRYIAQFRPMAELAIADLLRSPVSGATHYHHKDLYPYPQFSRPEHSTYLGQLGDHLFYREY